MADLLGAEVLYCVQSWMRPGTEGAYLDWLENKHMAEVVREPGMLWARKLALAEPREDGWNGVFLLYGLNDQAALEAYFNSDARQGFWQELKQFGDDVQSQRFFGTLDFAIRKNL